MNKYLYANIGFNSVWTSVIILWLISEENTMSFTESLIIAAIPTITGIIGTYLVTYKSNIKDNTKALKNLSDRIGLDKDLTLKKSIENKFNSISDDIGRTDNSSLTKQHNEIKQSIQKSFSVIEKRYSDEDAEYRKFTQNQYDLKKTIDNFSRDIMNI